MASAISVPAAVDSTATTQRALADAVVHFDSHGKSSFRPMVHEPGRDGQRASVFGVDADDASIMPSQHRS